MDYIPFLNLDRQTFENMRKDENLLPFLFAGYRFADSEAVIPIAVGGFLSDEGKYILSKDQKEKISRYSLLITQIRDLWGDDIFEESLSSSFSFYLKKYGAPEALSYSLTEEFSYTESLFRVAEKIRELLYLYSAAIGRKSRSGSVSDILDIDSFFPAKYYIENDGRLSPLLSLLFEKEQKLSGERKYQGENNYDLLTKRKLRKADIRTEEILSSLIDGGLVEVKADGVLALTAKSRLLGCIRFSGAVTLRSAENEGLGDELDALISSGELRPSPKFLAPAEKTFLEYLLTDRYKNSLNIPEVCLDEEKEYSEKKARENYPILLSVLIGISIKVIDEISKIPEGFFRK